MPSEFNLATPLANNPNMTALIRVLREEIELIDLTRLLVYLYETADEALLDILAGQLDMLGYNGWFLADTVEKKRNFLRQAVEIKKFAGTPYSIREAARALGIKGDIQIFEGFGNKHNGENRHDGTVTYGGGDWAKFRVIFSAADNPLLGSQTLNDFRNMVETLKPVRSVLIGVTVQ